MKNIKNKIALAVCVLLSACCFSSCKSESGSFEFASYTPSVSARSEEDWRIEAPSDPYVTFDGKVNASEYAGEKIVFSDTNDVTLTMYSRMAEQGIFFGFSSNDTAVYVNPDVSYYNNTGVEIQLALGGTESLNANVLQLRYSADGSIEEWIGIPSAKDYEYIRTYVDTVSKVVVNGTLNSSDCQGYEIEAYVPYTALHLTEAPESLVCAPSFNTRKSYNATGRTTWTIMVGSDFSDPSSWYRITKEGQEVVTGGFKTIGDRLYQSGSSNQFYYFNDEFTKDYYLSADVYVGDILGGDLYPKFGVVNKSGQRLLGYYFDIAGGETIHNVGKIEAETTEFKGTQWLWDSYSSHTFDVTENAETNYNTLSKINDLDLSQGVHVEMLRQNDTFLFLINGVPFFGDEGVQGMDDGSVAGLFFFNTKAEIEVKEYTSDEAEVAEKAQGLMPEKTIDADLSEWNKTTTLLKSEKDDTNGNEMSVYAEAGENGIYIAYETTHRLSTKIYSWDNVWHYNVNAEFWIGNTHFALTKTGNSGFMIGKMVTSEQTDGTYKTVAEIFVPYGALWSEKEYTLGVAFKTYSPEYEGNALASFHGDTWWQFTDRNPTDINARFTVEK
jgi:hypothetical protein